MANRRPSILSYYDSTLKICGPLTRSIMGALPKIGAFEVRHQVSFQQMKLGVPLAPIQGLIYLEKDLKMMRKAIVAFALFGLALYVVVMTGGSAASAKPGDPLSAERQPASLCTADEQVIFSCSLQRSGKIASLCGSKNLDKTTGYIQYRFGLPEKTELEFPSGRSDTRQKFRYAHYFRARVDETEISFDNKGYRYTIFDSYQGDMKPIEMSQGIRVSALLGSDKETELRCRSRAQANYGSLGDILPCDADSPINSDGCQ